MLDYNFLPFAKAEMFSVGFDSLHCLNGQKIQTIVGQPLQAVFLLSYSPRLAFHKRQQHTHSINKLYNVLLT